MTTSATAADGPTFSPDSRDRTTTATTTTSPRTHTWAILVCLIVYAILRIALIPSAADVTKSFSHDSAYIAIVAGNLLAGRGLMNDASWLVFLNPPALPMPFHNANPLYILATAGISYVTGADVVHAGLIVSALSSALLMLAVMWLVSYFANRRVALIVAVTSALFPPIYQLSLSMLPDALCLALSVAFMAAFVRVEEKWTWIAAGALFALAWLARSSSTLLLPAAFLYGCMAWGVRRTVTRCVGVGVAAFVVVSPWLWHCYQVWGKPLHSDASYYLIQDIVARKLGGDPDAALLRYWHSTTVPPSTGAILKADPVWFVKWVALGVPKVVIAMAIEWVSSSIASVVAIGVLLAAVIPLLPRVWRRPEWIACAVLAATAIGIFAIRPLSVEIRYLALVSIVAAIVLALITVRAVDDVRRGQRGLAVAVAAVGVVFWLALVPVSDVARTRFMRAPNAVRVQQQSLNRQVRDLVPSGPVVVETPYFYSYDTNRQALSIPMSDDSYLLDYMHRFGARAVLLSDAEMTFWRPEWSAGRIPANLHVVARMNNVSLLGLAQQP